MSARLEGRVIPLKPDGASPGGRRVLLDLGYEAIPIRGKAPTWKGWRSGDITAERLDEIEAAHPDHLSTGCRTGRMAVVDVDLWDNEHATEVSEAVQAVLGPNRLERIGRKGVALCYFNPEPIRKITITGQAPGGGYPNSTLVEFLGEGQQLACYGIHPDNSGRPYRWDDATLFDFPLEGLPQIDPALIREAAHAVMKTLETLGYSNLKLTGAGPSEPCDRGRSHGEPVTADMLEAMLSHIDPACDRLTWIKVAGAIKSARVIDLAAGDDDQDFDDADLFDRWSAGELNPDHAPGNYEGRPRL